MLRNVLAITLASLAFSLWGYILYATVFDDLWQALIGRSETDLINLAISRGLIQDFWVIAISVVQVLGIWAVLKWVKARTFMHYIGVSLLLATLIVLPSAGNTTLFVGTPLALLLLDYGHFLFGYAGIALVLFILNVPHKKGSGKFQSLENIS